MSAIKISDYNINIDANNVNYAESAGYAELTGPHNHNAIQIVDLNANVSSIVSNFKASSDSFGLVKIGEGINVSSGVISVNVSSFNGDVNAVAHFDIMPDVESSTDEVIVYTGETSSYVKGHIYKKEISGGNGELILETGSDEDYSSYDTDINGIYQINGYQTVNGLNMPIYKHKTKNYFIRCIFYDGEDIYEWDLYDGNDNKLYICMNTPYQDSVEAVISIMLNDYVWDDYSDGGTTRIRISQSNQQSI